MRILTWNVNVLRTCLDYHPFSSMKKRNVEGLLDELGAQIACFQEHKTRRAQLDKATACPGPYDGFWTFNRAKTGYSGVCTYVDARYCVPLKAEEGITGLLLGDKASTMRPPWTAEERIGSYPDTDEMVWCDEEGAGPFDVKRLDMEGRAVICDFGLFILFNLYSPNEGNESRRPYKMNFLKALQERVRLLMLAGRDVVVAGDLNIMRAPIDSGEGGIRTSAEQHYQHPARVIFNDWCAPRGPMIDVVRESFPERDDMFTCWNQKLDARPSNYGSRIDYILCSPGLRPWIKGGDILPKIHGSDHCPVYIDLHETIEHPTRGTLHLRDMLNPPDRPPSTAPVYPNDVPREAPEPPRFATKFLEEFSGKQTTLKSFFGGGGVKRAGSVNSGSSIRASPPGTSRAPGGGDATEIEAGPSRSRSTRSPSTASTPPLRSSSTSVPLGLARAAFDALDQPGPSNGMHKRKRSATAISVDLTGDDDSDIVAAGGGGGSAANTVSSKSKSAGLGEGIRRDSASTAQKAKLPTSSSTSGTSKAGKANGKAGQAGQASIASFFTQPRTKAAALPATRSKSDGRAARRTSSPPTALLDTFVGSSGNSEDLDSHGFDDTVDEDNDLDPDLNGYEDAEDDASIAAAIASAEAERAEEREAKKAKVTPIWNSLFAKKLPPLCMVHQKPCKDFIVKIPGPNKGKRFWLCSLPVGAGYDSGRSKRRREDVNPEFRCDFFLWDSANSRKETTK